jgi:ABC-type transport system substrate-binding protein
MVGTLGAERFDAALHTTGGAADYMQVIGAKLISSDVKDRRRVLVPGIATKWEISGDGKTWAFTVRKGGAFHDGKAITTQDVLWTLQHSIGPEAKEKTKSVRTIAWSRVMERIEQTGPDQVSVTTKGPAADLIPELSEGITALGGILPKRATLYDEEEAKAYEANPVGAGVMKLVKHVPVDLMRFERFGDYYYQPKYGLPKDKRVRFTQLDLRPVPEEATRVAAIRAGEADFAPISLSGRKQVEAGGGRVIFGPEGVLFDIRQLGCWDTRFPCHDKRVRQALNYAIDKELIRDRLYGGPEVMEIKGFFRVTPSTLGYLPGMDPYPFDPDKARQLLVDAGYPGGKGYGKVIINAYVSASIPLVPEAAQLVGELWKRELGLDVAVNVGDQAGFRKLSRDTDRLWGQILWGDNETRIDASPNLRGNYGRIDRSDGPHRDPELAALALKAVEVTSPGESEKVLTSTYWRLWEEAHDIHLGYINIPWAVGPRILTWEPYPLAFYPSALHTITLK